MPKETFLNLPKSKQAMIDDILLQTFCAQSISQVKVSQIVDQMGMSRGAFYKYFDDLEDAYRYIIKKHSLIIHQDILGYIQEFQSDFFKGIERYLLWCSALNTSDAYWKALKLLTSSEYGRTMKRIEMDETNSMMKQWLTILRYNQFQIVSTAEASSFLYFMMELVMGSLSDFIVNDWTSEALLEDYHYKVKWLVHGVVAR